MRSTSVQIVGIILILTSIVSGFTTKSTSRRDSLLATLDSLEYAIQDARRNGDDLQSIVEQAESIQASIDMQSEETSGNQDLSENDDAVTGANSREKKSRSLSLPTSIVDWMIVLVGAVAAIALLLLLALQGIKISRRKKLMKRVAEQPVPVKQKVVQPTQKMVQPTPISVDTGKRTAVEEPAVVKATYTRQGMMKSQSEESSPKEVPSIVEETVSSRSDPQFVQQMLAELMAKKESVEKQAAAVDFDEEPSLHATDFSDELQSFDTLYDGLEDIMSELDSEMSAVMDEPAESTGVEFYEEPTPPEPVQPRALTARETILALAEAELTPSEIARKLSMSVGEVQLILSMARRS